MAYLPRHFGVSTLFNLAHVSRPFLIFKNIDSRYTKGQTKQTAPPSASVGLSNLEIALKNRLHFSKTCANLKSSTTALTLPYQKKDSVSKPRKNKMHNPRKGGRGESAHLPPNSLTFKVILEPDGWHVRANGVDTLPAPVADEASALRWLGDVVSAWDAC
jgi:hypothetical protein